MNVNQYLDKPTLNVREEWKNEGRKAFVKDIVLGFNVLVRFIIGIAVIFGGVTALVLACAWVGDNYGVWACFPTGVGILAGIVLFEAFKDLRTADNKRDYISCIEAIWWSGSCLALCVVLITVSVFTH